MIAGPLTDPSLRICQGGIVVLKVITGFLLGVAVTLAVVYGLQITPSESRAKLTGNASSPAVTAKAQRPTPGNRVDEVSDDAGDDSFRLRSAESNPNEVTSASQAQSSTLPEQVARSTGPAQKSPTTLADNQYPPEIADMIDNRVNKELQARYENDRREDSWATYMEGQLAAYFARKPSLAQFYFSLVDCRTSVCSIHALGYGPDALTQWNTATADLVSQPWFEFNSMSMNRRNPEPDILGIVLIVTKKPSD